jgi:autotransporter-associated beta strand protein
MRGFLGSAERRAGGAKAAAMAVACLIVLGGWTGAGAQLVKDADGSGYTFTHSAGAGFGDWQTAGARGNWTEVSGGGVRAADEKDGVGFLTLRPASHNCSDDGTYTVTLDHVKNYSHASAVIFRYTGQSNFYAIRIRYNYNNDFYPLLFSKNTLYTGDVNANERPLGNSFTAANGRIVLKIEVIGDEIKVYCNGVYAGAITDSDNKSGQVGYAQGNNWNSSIIFQSSSWRDTNTVSSIRPNYLAWNTVAGNNVTPGNGNWTTDKYWADGLANNLVNWIPGRSALFSGTGNSAITVSAAASVDTMLFESSGYTIQQGTGGVLTMGSGRIRVESGRTATINAVLGGTNGLNFSGGGTLTLGGTNTYTGATTVSAGTLIAAARNALGTGAVTATATGASLQLNGATLGNSSLTIGSGNLVSKSGANTVSGSVALSGSASNTIEVEAGLHLSGAITGTAGLTKTGAGTLTLSGANTYTGVTTVSNGALQIGNNGTTGSLTGGINLATGTTSVTFNRNNALTYAGAITGLGNLTMEGAGALVLSGTNTYTGATAVNAGTLQIGSAANLGAGTVTVAASATLVVNVASGAAEFSRAVTGAGTFLKSGAGTLNLTGAGSVPTGALNVLGGTLNAGYAISVATVTVGSGATLAGTAMVTASGSGGISVTGGTLAGSGGYKGAVTLTGGTIEKSNDSLMQITGSLTMNAASTVKLTLTETMKTTRRIYVTDAAALGGATLNITNGAAVTSGMIPDETRNYQILQAGSFTGNFNNITGIDRNDYNVSTIVSGGFVTLRITKPLNVNRVRNTLKVERATFEKDSEEGRVVSVVVSGFTYLKEYSPTTDNNPRVENVYIWYKPGLAASGMSDTTAGGGGGRLPVAPSWTGDTGTFSILVPNAKSSLDTLYYFNANVYWNVADSVQPSMMSPAASAYLRDPKSAVKANGLTVAVETPVSDESGVTFTITVSGQDATELDPPQPPGQRYKPRVDSVGVWLKRGGDSPTLAGNSFASSAVAGSEIHKYSLEALRQNGRLILPRQEKVKNADFDTFYVAVAPRWTGVVGVDSIARPLVVASPQRVPNPNKRLPVNPCALDAEQSDKRQPSVKVTVSAGEFDTLARSVSVELSFEPSMVPPIDIKAFSLGDFDPDTSFTIMDNGFVGAERLVYWKINVLDKDGIPSEKQGQFTVGRPRPLYPANVVAEPAGGGKMALSWDNITVAANRVGNVDKSRVIVAYSLDGFESGMDILKFSDTVIVPASRAGAVVRDLAYDTDYQFAVALYDVVDESKPEWNLISDVYRFSANSGPESIVPNIFEIVRVAFNADNQTFSVVYRQTDANISKMVLHYDVFLETDSVTGGQRPFSNNSVGAVDSIPPFSLGEKIMFDTTYRVAVFSVDTLGVPSAARSMMDVAVGPFSRQEVVIHSDSTGYANNRKFGISTVGWPSIVSIPETGIKAEVISSTAGSIWINPDYFTPVGDSTGYRYRNIPRDIGDFETFFTISISADGIAAHEINAVKIYRFADGVWDVLHDTKYENGYFKGKAGAITTKDTMATYRLMINNFMPKVEIAGAPVIIIDGNGSFYRPPVSVNDSISETVKVESGVGNARVSFLYARADNSILQPAAPTDSTRTLTVCNFSYTVNKSVVSGASYGVLAYLIVSDGYHKDTINVSRQVISENYTGFQVTRAAKTWQPFAAQVDINTKNEKMQVKSVLKQALFDESDEFKISDTLFRLFRWYPNNWVEYDGNNDNLFEMKTGNLMWLKTQFVPKELFKFADESNKATSVSLIETFKFEEKLQPGQWTDFVMPFGFDICVGDILDATGAGAADNLQFYKWTASGSTYRAEPIWLGNNPQVNSRESPLSGGKDPFTVFNSGSTEITLSIPPRPAFMSGQGGASGRLAKSADGSPASGGLWYYTIRAGTENTPELSGVMVGYTPVKRAFAVPPSFSKESVVIIDDNGGGSIGHYFGPDLNGGRTVKLRFQNGERQKATFKFSAKESGVVPAGTRVSFVNATTGQELAARGSEFAVAVGGLSHEDVYMVIGGGEYRNRIGAGAPASKFAVSHVNVNQAARSARIKFYIPLAGIEKVEVSAYDIKGRMVWRNMQTVRPSTWNTIEWNGRQSRNGPISAGLYILRVKAIDAKGRTTAVENRRLTFAR